MDLVRIVDDIVDLFIEDGKEFTIKDIVENFSFIFYLHCGPLSELVLEKEKFEGEEWIAAVAGLSAKQKGFLHLMKSNGGDLGSVSETLRFERQMRLEEISNGEKGKTLQGY